VASQTKDRIVEPRFFTDPHTVSKMTMTTPSPFYYTRAMRNVGNTDASDAQGKMHWPQEKEDLRFVDHRKRAVQVTVDSRPAKRSKSRIENQDGTVRWAAFAQATPMDNSSTCLPILGKENAFRKFNVDQTDFNKYDEQQDSTQRSIGRHGAACFFSAMDNGLVAIKGPTLITEQDGSVEFSAGAMPPLSCINIWQEDCDDDDVSMMSEGV
jgi:hypothetical protein